MNGATATDDARHGNRHVSPNIRVRDLRGSSVCTRDDRSSVSCIYRFGAGRRGSVPRERTGYNRGAKTRSFFSLSRSRGTNKHDGVTPCSVNSVDKWVVSATRIRVVGGR